MGLRAAAFLTAGSARVPFWKFVVADAGAALVGVPLAFGLAYFFTDQIKAIMADVHRAERWLGLAGLLALAAMLVVGVWRWHRRVGEERLGGEPAPFYVIVRMIARFWIWFFFERVEVRHPERVPRMAPVLLCINHPNNLIDSLLVGSVLPRQVHYLATGVLFRNSLIARLLVALGVIPVYRKADNPDRMDRNVEMFAACDEAFDRGRLIAIYPEGATRAEAHLQRIKTGAARIALGYEAHAPGRLTVVPVGLSFAARKRFRGRVLVSFGEPVDVSSYLAGYREEPAKALHTLTAAIQGAMEREVVHVELIDTAAFGGAVEALYRGELERELWEERGSRDDTSIRSRTSGRLRPRSSTSANRTLSASSGFGSGSSVTTLDLPPTGSGRRRCGLALSGRRSGSGLPGHGRRSWASRSLRTARL